MSYLLNQEKLAVSYVPCLLVILYCPRIVVFIKLLFKSVNKFNKVVSNNFYTARRPIILLRTYSSYLKRI